MKQTFITLIHNFNLDSKLSAPIEIKDGLFITNNPKFIQGLLEPFLNLETIIGKMEYRYLISGSPILYSINKAVSELPLISEVNNFMVKAQFFSQAIWLLKDSSVNIELCFGISPTKESYDVHSNYMAAYFTDSKGKVSTINFNKYQLRDAISKYILDTDIDYNEKFKEKAKLVKGTTRQNRSLHHFMSARGSNSLEYKIANYCAGFESLLSTSQSELSHQLSERLAILLNNSKLSKIDIYKISKRIYGIRSKVVHGGTVDTKDLEELSTYCDDFARQLFNNSLGGSEFADALSLADSSKYDEYFINKILN